MNEWCMNVWAFINDCMVYMVLEERVNIKWTDIIFTTPYSLSICLIGEYLFTSSSSSSFCEEMNNFFFSGETKWIEIELNNAMTFQTQHEGLILRNFEEDWFHIKGSEAQELLRRQKRRAMEFFAVCAPHLFFFFFSVSYHQKIMNHWCQSTRMMFIKYLRPTWIILRRWWMVENLEKP